MSPEITVSVDQTQFLEFLRVYWRIRHTFRASKVILALGGGHLTIGFSGGGCALACDCSETLVAELTGISFGKLASKHIRQKPKRNETMELTFRPEFGEVATQLAGVKARITTTK